jgi:hypothetical protein
MNKTGPLNANLAVQEMNCLAAKIWRSIPFVAVIRISQMAKTIHHPR